MQIIRNHNLNLVFPSTAPQPDANTQPGVTATASAPVPAPPPTLTAIQVTPQESPGVIYTGSDAAGVQDLGADDPDLDDMSLESQLAFGRNRGVFTKITLSKDGVLVAKPHHSDALGKSMGFAASAAATIKDFEEGIASLKKHSTDTSDKPSHVLAGKFKSLQQLTAKLNVFA